MTDDVRKRVDESWKEQAEREKHVVSHAAPASSTESQPTSGQPDPSGADEGGVPEARFDLFLSGLAMEAFIALGEMAHPQTKKRHANLPHAKYLIDLIGLLEEKTRGNLSVDEARILKDALYQLRMRYLAKAGGA